jgi:hypothetical protein
MFIGAIAFSNPSQSRHPVNKSADNNSFTVFGTLLECSQFIERTETAGGE